MGKGAEADKKAKEEGKGKLPAGGAGTSFAGQSIKTWADLSKLPGPEINKFYQENPKEFQRLKNAHFKSA
jgi:hypothetical protein